MSLEMIIDFFQCRMVGLDFVKVIIVMFSSFISIQNLNRKLETFLHG